MIDGIMPQLTRSHICCSEWGLGTFSLFFLLLRDGYYSQRGRRQLQDGASRTMPRHIRDFSALCGAKFESQLGKCTENNKRNRPKLDRTARKFLLCGITIQFKIYYSYGFGSWEVNREMWLLLRMGFAEKCYFFGFKSSYFGAPFIWPWLFQT